MPQGQHFQQSQGFLSRLVAGHILQDRLGLTVLRDHQGLALLAERGQAEWAVGAEVVPGASGPSVTVSYVDVPSAKTVFSFTAEVGPSQEAAFVSGVVGTMGWLIEGGARTDDVRGAFEDARVQWEAGKLDNAALAASIADLEGELGAVFDAGRGAIEVPRLTDADLEKYTEREGSKPWEQVSLTRAQYLRWRNSDLPLDAFRLRAAGRLRSVIVRGGGGFVTGPYGQSYDLRYVVGLTDAGWNELEVDTFQELVGSSGPNGTVELGFGVLPWLEVAGALDVRTGTFSYLQHQEVAGDNNTLLLPAETAPMATRMLGGRVYFVPMPVAQVRPTLGAGISGWRGRKVGDVWGVPDFAPQFPAPTLLLVEVFPGVEVRASDVLMVWARGRMGAALGTRLWTETTGEPLLQNRGAPSGSPGGGGGVEVGVALKFGPIGGVKALDSSFDDEPEP